MIFNQAIIPDCTSWFSPTASSTLVASAIFLILAAGGLVFVHAVIGELDQCFSVLAVLRIEGHADGSADRHAFRTSSTIPCQYPFSNPCIVSSTFFFSVRVVIRCSLYESMSFTFPVFTFC